MSDSATLRRQKPKPGAAEPGVVHDLIAAPITITISPAAATLRGKVLRSRKIKLYSMKPDAVKKRKYRARVDDGFSAVRLPTKDVVDAVDHLEKMHPGIHDWPIGDPRFDRAFAGYVAALLKRDRERSGK